MAAPRHLKQRKALIAAACKLNPLGINQGTSGNLSLRAGAGLLITPSSVAYEALQPVDIVAMGFDGRWSCERPERRPSSEWHFHRAILRDRSEFGAVVHCHARYATALSCLRKAIPPFHYMVALAGGPTIRCAPYATFGSEALSEAALEALKDRKACLLANHGLIACGHDLESALALAVEVESLAAQYLIALQSGTPKLLSRAEINRVLAKMHSGAGYGSLRQP